MMTWILNDKIEINNLNLINGSAKSLVSLATIYVLQNSELNLIFGKFMSAVAMIFLILWIFLSFKTDDIN